MWLWGGKTKTVSDIKLKEPECSHSIITSLTIIHSPVCCLWKWQVCIYLTVQTPHRSNTKWSLWQQFPVDIAWFGCHSELTWMCRLLFLAIAPSCPSKAPVQDGAKRGVTTGLTRGYWLRPQKRKNTETQVRRVTEGERNNVFLSLNSLHCVRPTDSYLFVQELCNEPWRSKRMIIYLGHFMVKNKVANIHCAHSLRCVFQC